MITHAMEGKELAFNGGDLKMHLQSRKLPLSSKAVSDVISNALVLAITVVMFAVVFLWVQSIPQETEKTHVDFVAELEILDNGTGVVKITHAGGETLTEEYTVSDKHVVREIYIFIDGKYETFEISDGLGGDNRWSIGETWYYYSENITYNSTVFVRIVGWDRVLFEQEITPEKDTIEPIITLIAPDEELLWVVPEFVAIIEDDPTGSGIAEIVLTLDNVLIPTNEYKYDPTTKKLTFKPSELEYGRHQLRIRAVDHAGNSAIAERAFTLAKYTEPNNPDGLQGFALLDSNGNLAESFDYGERVTLRVASGSVAYNNYERLIIIDDNGNEIMNISDFTQIDNDPYYIYEYTFFAPLNSGYYYIKDLNLKFYQKEFSTVQSFKVGNPESYYIKTYDEGNATETFSPVDIAYVKVVANDVNESLHSKVEIKDYTGQIKVLLNESNVTKIPLGNGLAEYYLSINLSACKTSWFSGKNWYSLAVKIFGDNTIFEGATQISIEGIFIEAEQYYWQGSNVGIDVDTTASSNLSARFGLSSFADYSFVSPSSLRYELRMSLKIWEGHSSKIKIEVRLNDSLILTSEQNISAEWNEYTLGNLSIAKGNNTLRISTSDTPFKGDYLRLVNTSNIIHIEAEKFNTTNNVAVEEEFTASSGKRARFGWNSFAVYNVELEVGNYTLKVSVQEWSIWHPNPKEIKVSLDDVLIINATVAVTDDWKEYSIGEFYVNSSGEHSLNISTNTPFRADYLCIESGNYTLIIEAEKFNSSRNVGIDYQFNASNSHRLAWGKEGYADYAVAISKSGNYSLGMRIQNFEELVGRGEKRIKVYELVENEKVLLLEINTTVVSASFWKVITLGELDLDEGIHTIRIENAGLAFRADYIVLSEVID